MNEVFGEENFAGNFIIKSNPRGSQSDVYSAKVHEYVLCYIKNAQVVNSFTIQLNREMLKEYKYEDENGKYRLLGLRQRGGAWRRVDRPLLFYPIYVNEDEEAIALEKGKGHKYEIFPIQPTTGEEGTWRWSREKIITDFDKIIARRIKRDGTETWDIFQKDYLYDGGEQKGTKAKTIWDDKEFNYQNGTNEVKNLFDGKSVFDFPKPTLLQKRMLELSNDHNSIVLDFFAGSATTAHAVLDLNKEDGGNRKFILIQLPEKCDEKSEAYKAGYKTIAEIGKERIRRVIKKIKNEELKIEKEKGRNLFEEANTNSLDLGFKVFKLQESNFKIWRTKIANEEQLVEQLQQHLEPLDENAKIENVLYELLLKSGVALTATIETKDGFYLVNDTEIALILERVDKEIIKTVIDIKPQKVMTLDRLFNNNDPLKTNTALQMKDAGIEFKVV